MGALARSTHAHGGEVIGVMPKGIAEHDVGFSEVDEMIVTDTLRERKKNMEEKADAFVALPGGFGTIEELMETLTLKQLGHHNKAVVIVNANGFYNPLLDFFKQLYREKFAKPETAQIFHLCETVEQIADYLDTYSAPDIGKKWFDHRRG